MNATEKFIAADAHVDNAAIAPLPNSRKVYAGGSRPDIRVPMREISQSDTPTAMGGEKNPPIYVYDCSGPYTDPTATIDIRTGLVDLRQSWIAERNDTEAGRIALPRPPSQATPRQGRRQCEPDALRAARHDYAGDGIRGDSGEFAPR